MKRNSSSKAFIAISLIAFFAFFFQNCGQGFINQDVSQTSEQLRFHMSSDAALSNPLQNSCYCIDCTANEIRSMSGLQCKHIRWGRFAWDPFDGQTGSVDQIFQRTMRQQISESVKASQDSFGADVSFEVGIPEYFHPNYRQLNVTSAELAVIDDYLKKFVGVNLPAAGAQPFSNMPVHSRGFDVPDLNSPTGLRWHFFLGKTGIDAGATSLYISQINIRLHSAGGTGPFIGLLKALRAYAEDKYGKSLIIGAESINDLAEPYAGAFTSQIQYVKYITDTDVAHPDGRGGWQTYRADGSPIACLGQKYLDPSKPPLLNSAGQQIGQLCVTSPDKTGLRVFNTDNHSGAHFVTQNPYRIPVLLELDGCQECKWTGGSLTTVHSASNAGNVIFHKKAGQEAGTTCHSRVRNGLTTTMQFMAQPKWVRDQFQMYMVKTAFEMTGQTGVPTFFPRLLKVDQNHYWQIESATLSKAAEQKALVRQCPESNDGPGIAKSIGLSYYATSCGQLEATRASLDISALSGMEGYGRSLASASPTPVPQVTATPVGAAPAATPARTRAETEAIVLGGYMNVLGRSYSDAKNDTAGMNYWVNRLMSGTSVQVFTAELKASDEYFVHNAYMTLLKRDPVQSEVNYYVSELTSGRKSRAHVASHFQLVCANHTDNECR